MTHESFESPRLLGTNKGRIALAIIAALLVTLLGLLFAGHRDRPLMSITGDEFKGGSASISGTAKVGSTLSASGSGFSPAPGGYRYQWLRDGGEIGGATSRQYTVQNADSGRTISVQITATKTGYPNKSVVSGGKTVAAGGIRVGTVSLTGAGGVGKTLTGRVGGFSPTPSSYVYQWLRDGSPISGANSTRYTLTAKDAGHKISFRATAKLAGYGDATGTSPGINVK